MSGKNRIDQYNIFGENVEMASLENHSPKEAPLPND
jgi:hypothetical protein